MKFATPNDIKRLVTHIYNQFGNVDNTADSDKNVSSASKWSTARNINGMTVDGTANRTNYGTCSTAAATAAKTVSCTGFALSTGAEITVKFTTTNSAANPTLNVNSTGAKPIFYRGAAISAGYLAANRTYTFRYNGTQFDLVGDIDTNSTYDLSDFGITASASELNKLDGVTATTAEINYLDGVTSAIQAQLNGKLSTSGTAARATADSAGQNIADTYIKGLSVNGRTITYTKGDGGTGTITTQDTNTTYGSAGESLGLVKTGGDVTIADGIISVNDDSHAHTIANVDGLQTALNGKLSTSGTAAAATKLANSRNFSITGGATASAVGFDGTGNVSLNITSLDASKLTGTIPIDRLPAGALERLIPVDDEEARFALTTTDVQLGDTVQQLDTGVMYLVVNTSELDNESGYKEYTAGSATSVPWSGVTGKPLSFTPSAHTHEIDEVTGLQSALNGKLSTTGTAAKATADSQGQNIADTYIKALSVSGRTITYTKGDGGTGTITTQDTNTTYSVFDGASSSAAGGTGLVPAPAAGYQSRFLRADATWQTISLSTFGVTATAAELNKLDGVTATATELNYVDGVTSNIQTQLNSKLSTTGTAAASTKLATARNINGLSFDGTANRVNYGTCSTAAGTATKVVACTGFALVTGAEITVKFTVTNTASNPTLNVNSTGAKTIYYNGSAISAGYLKANKTYSFRYNGTQYDLVGDIDTNTTYSLSSFGVTATAAELNKLDGLATTKTELGYLDGVTGNVQTQLNGKLSTSGTAAAASKLATARTITLSGDASGSVSFDGSANVTLTATVKDDSHNHTIANVDGLQSRLNILALDEDGELADSD